MGERIEFPSNGHTCSGYLAVPPGGHGPGVVVVQEWWGLVPHIEDVCDRLAQEGFVALSPDLYHGDAASNHEPDKAGKLAMALQMDEAARDVNGAVAWLGGSERSTGNRVGIVGFCMGGAVALYAAAHNPALAAVVAYYPTLGLKPQIEQLDAGRIRGAVQAHFATQDEFNTPELVEQFQKRLSDGGVDSEVFWYEDADHAFFNDTRPEVHHPEWSQLAWERTLAFFRKHLVTSAAPVG